MKLISHRADGSVHRTWERVDVTDHPWAFWIPAKSIVREADESTWYSDYAVVALFWPRCFYQVFLLLKDTGTDYYCNIITPPTYNERKGAVEFIDLDLDVLLTGDTLQVVDEEEFAARSLFYSQEWIDEAETAKRTLLQYAHNRTGPFSLRTAEVWRRYRGATP